MLELLRPSSPLPWPLCDRAQGSSTARQVRKNVVRWRIVRDHSRSEPPRRTCRTKPTLSACRYVFFRSICRRNRRQPRLNRRSKTRDFRGSEKCRQRHFRHLFSGGSRATTARRPPLGGGSRATTAGLDLPSVSGRVRSRHVLRKPLKLGGDRAVGDRVGWHSTPVEDRVGRHSTPVEDRVGSAQPRRGIGWVGTQPR